MFLTYAFLHAGLGHLVGNMITLLALGRIIVIRVGQKGFLMIYAASALGGAALFGAMSVSAQPMVGASGALFGLAGAWQYWDYAEAGKRRHRIWRLIRAAGLLVLLNVLFWIGLDGRLAWQTHLGGFVAGWAVAAAVSGRWREKVQTGTRLGQ